MDDPRRRGPPGNVRHVRREAPFTSDVPHAPRRSDSDITGVMALTLAGTAMTTWLSHKHTGRQKQKTNQGKLSI